MNIMRWSAFFLLVSLPLASPSQGQEVLAGFDLWETIPGQTFDDLGGGNLGVLCPGWQVINPPDGIIPLKGIPLAASDCCPGADLGSTATMVERLEDTVGLDTGPDELPIQICDLHLESVAPFTVRNMDTQEVQQWRLEVDLDPNVTQPVGTMTITRADASGGTFVTDELRVIPQLTFRRTDNNNITCQANAPVIEFSSNPVNWVYVGLPNKIAVPECASNFFSTDDFDEQALIAAHFNTEPPCECEVRLNEVIRLNADTCKYIFVAKTNCDVSNDFHLELAGQQPFEVIGCAVNPQSSWFCDVMPDGGWWWTITNPIAPGEDLPEMALVVRCDAAGELLLDVRFTRDGHDRCTDQTTFPSCCDIVPLEPGTWGRIKARYKN